MTEAEWLACTDPYAAWDQLAANATPRQRRLFSCAACRWVWHLLGEHGRHAVEISDRFADGLVGPDEFASVRHAAWSQKLTEHSYEYWSVQAAVENDERMADAWSQSLGRGREEITEEDRPERLRRLSLLCEIIGAPFRPTTIALDILAWQSSIIPRIAQSIYDDLAFDQMPILADALEEAGCTDADILNHCRQPREHVRGCWVIDLILDKK